MNSNIASPMKQMVPLDNKAIYYQRPPPNIQQKLTAPSGKAMLPLQNSPMPTDGSRQDTPFDSPVGPIDPLEYISLPDLFFGDQNYQNMLPPALEMPNPDGNIHHYSDHQIHALMNNPPPQYPPRQLMQAFPPEKVNDFKHVIYNLLVENHNNPHKSNFVMPIQMDESGVVRTGFCFNEAENPEKKLPELYAQHIRKARLDQEDISSVFVHDLYKFYLRASVELLSKYFEKRDKYTYLYEDTPLFISNDTLDHAEERIRNMKTRARKKRKMIAN